MTDTAVIGAGTMGAGIAAQLALAGADVALVEATAELARAGRNRVDDVLARIAERGHIEAGDISGCRARIHAFGSVEALPSGLALIVEAVPERLELKRDVLAAAERREPQLLATNTSAIPLAQLAEPLQHGDRFVGMHFFNPVAVMELVEVVVGDQTSAAARDEAVMWIERLGKTPIVVKDMPGFASSRLGVALGLEAMRMVEDGVAEPADIDTVMQMGYRHPIGPLRLSDLVGLDVRLDIARNLAEAYGPRFQPPEILERLVADGRLGKKSGHGFFAWTQ